MQYNTKKASSLNANRGSIFCLDPYSYPVESARNVAEATEYWLDLFSKPWLPGGRTKDKSI
jgi:hypothetical protein